MVWLEEKLKINRIAELNNGFLVIFEDGSELRLSEEVYFTNFIYEKEEMSQEEINNLLFKEKVTDGLILCKRYLAGSLKPGRRLLMYMEEKGFEKEIAEHVILILENEEYLDDYKYALKRIKRKMASSPVSRLFLMAFLENEGISKETAEKAVQTFKIDDYKTAEVLANKKLKSNKGNKRKTAVYLSSKGFNDETIADVLRIEGIWNV